MSDLLKLSKPFQERFIKEKPGSFKASYVTHSCVVEHLLGIMGPFNQEVKEIIRGADGVVEGAIVRFTFTVDGDDIIIEEAMKDCISDAVKRAASRIGLGTHLWSGNEYILHDVLSRREEENE